MNTPENFSTYYASLKARTDMREDRPRNPYDFDTPEYWAYAKEVSRVFDEEMRSARHGA